MAPKDTPKEKNETNCTLDYLGHYAIRKYYFMASVSDEQLPTTHAKYPTTIRKGFREHRGMGCHPQKRFSGTIYLSEMAENSPKKAIWMTAQNGHQNK